ncbi:penicillin-binding transpeptidase domain-containing protein [Amycolatopsis sp. CA-230715]|uniref:penicillin-binding transpeptidase domain-containing protein n=1 Tax=Amycolatopsis sp. CA-230715 TaxID=2745196 RepID=UPI0020B23B0C|nr:penicillin-binding transpeptidase domain-containing protein [Amycolatopsis sp. CA-230715]
MKPGVRKAVLSIGALAVVGIVAAAVFVLRGGSSESPAAENAASSQEDPAGTVSRFLDALSAKNLDAAAALTDDPAAAKAAFDDVTRGLVVTKLAAKFGDAGPTEGDRSPARYTMTWTLGANRVWTYPAALDLVRSGSRWAVHWSPHVLHPKLEAGQHLVLRTGGAGDAVLDRDGKPLLSWGPVGPRPVEPAIALELMPALIRYAAGQAGNGWAVARTDGAGKTIDTLFGKEVDRKPLISTLSTGLQKAAEAAVDTTAQSAVLVALQPSTGDILAVARNNGQQHLNPFTGLYAPGSTFKIATATAALESGTATADTVLECPGTIQLGQRTIPNDNKFVLPPVPLHSAFAHSCNTTFAQLASQLPPDALKKAADQYGLNADFDVPGLQTEAGKVEATGSAAEQVEAGIGQGKVLVSPFGGALMAATVAAGKAVTPKLWHGVDTKVGAGYGPPPAPVLASVRAMMREVVTAGTATGAKGAGTVFGKTGTAQLPDPSKANGWFVGYRGDLAFAVMLAASNSSAPAVTLATKFLNAAP